MFSVLAQSIESICLAAYTHTQYVGTLPPKRPESTVTHQGLHRRKVTDGTAQKNRTQEVRAP